MVLHWQQQDRPCVPERRERGFSRVEPESVRRASSRRSTDGEGGIPGLLQNQVLDYIDAAFFPTPDPH
jgi:hypothetical protein